MYFGPITRRPRSFKLHAALATPLTASQVVCKHSWSVGVACWWLNAHTHARKHREMGARVLADEVLGIRSQARGYQWNCGRQEDLPSGLDLRSIFQLRLSPFDVRSFPIPLGFLGVAFPGGLRRRASLIRWVGLARLESSAGPPRSSSASGHPGRRYAKNVIISRTSNRN